MVATYTQKQRPMEVTTALGPDVLLLTSFVGRETVSQPFEFHLGLLAENHKKIAFNKLLGQPITIRLSLGANGHRHFHGIISRFSQGQRDNDFTYYTAHVVPRLWLFTKKSQSRIFQRKSVPEILKEVLAGLDLDFRGVQGKFHPRDYCVQYRETDFAFASRLMEEEGIYYFFTHTADGHTMVLANTPESHPEVPKPAQVVYDENEGGNRATFRVTSWEKVQELRSGKVTLRDHTFEIPRANLEAVKRIAPDVEAGKVNHSLQVANGALELYDFPGGYAGRFDGVDAGGVEHPADVEKVFDDNGRTAAIRMEQEATAGLVIRGTSNCRQFVCGHRFTLEGHFDADGPYVITSVDHDAELSNDFRSGDPVKFDYVNRFSCIPLSLPFRPQRVTPRPHVEGTQTAVVVGPPGEEIFCDKYGRVKVQFRWDRQGQSDANSSCWVRVATAWAGQKWGVVHIPRIGHEVVVDFLEGNPDEPIIVGSVYNAEQMPPNDLPGKKMVSGLKSNTTPGGGGYNGIAFDDTKNNEQLVMHAQYDMHTKVLHDQTLDVGHDQTVTIKHDQTVTVKHDQIVNVKHDRTVNVTHDEITNVDHDETLNVKNDRKTTVTGTFTEDITKDTAITIKEGKLDHKVAAGTATYHVEGDLTETYNGNQKTTVGKDIVIVSSNGKVNITAASEIKLVCGLCSLTMSKDGTIILSGTKITSTATAAHEILGKPVKIN